jgi:hypothetical protein
VHGHGHLATTQWWRRRRRKKRRRLCLECSFEWFEKNRVEKNRVEKKTGGKKNRWKKKQGGKKHALVQFVWTWKRNTTENTEQCKTPTRAMYPSPHAPTTAASIPRFYVRVVLCRGRALGAFYLLDRKSENMSISLNQF